MKEWVAVSLDKFRPAARRPSSAAGTRQPSGIDTFG